MSTTKIMTAVSGVVVPEREAEFLDGYRLLNEAPKPAGLLRTELLRRSDGGFVIQTVWRDRDALMAARDPSTPPPALALLDKVGAIHTHDVLTVEAEYAT
jgi:Antibiotic biosynthesis monooxygenase